MEKEQMEREEELMQSSPKRFLEVLKTDGGDLVLVNVVFLLSCLLLVTIPPAVFALHQVIRRTLDDKSGQVRDYWEAFRNNWKKAWGVFLLTGVP